MPVPGGSVRVSSFRWIVVLLAGAAISCGEGTEERSRPAQPLHFASLKLQADPPRPTERAIERYRLLVPDPTKPWTVNEKFHAPQLISDGETEKYVLALDQKETAKINLIGPFDGRAFNTVAIEVETQRKTEFTLRFVSAGKLLDIQGTARSKGGTDKQVLQFQLPTLYKATEKIGRMRLICTGPLHDFRLHSVDLLHKPLDLLLPSPDSGADLILVGEEKRRGVGLSPEYGVKAHGELGQNAVLRFSYGAPGQPEGTPNAEHLQLNLRGSAGHEETHRFTPVGESGFAWHDVRLPLSKFEGDTIEIGWKVEAAPLSNWALCEPGILMGEGTPTRVLLITSDTHRADHLGASGSGVNVRTPYLDTLAERGILFEDCFTATNITNPSHIALMTAQHPRDTGILTNNEPLSLSADTLSEAFQQAGFATFASVSARHLSNRTSGLGQGFDRMSEPRIIALRKGGVSVEAMKQWIESNQDVPLFMWMHVFDAHVPYAPPPELLEIYYDDPALAFDPDAPPIPGIPSHVYDFIFPGLKDLDYPRALYAAEVTYLDEKLNRILAMPSMENAVIGFTSDHGESLGEHGVYYAHADLYPDSLHVPLILSYPGGDRGVRSNASVDQIDLARTLLDLAGLISVEFPGNNLLERVSMEDPPGPPRYAIGAGAACASICVDDWHLIFALTEILGHHRVDPRPRHQVALYNLKEDPKANNDLLESEFERAAAMRDQLLTWLGRANDLGWRGVQVMDEETLRSLEALGYTAGAKETPTAHELVDPDCDCEWCARFDQAQ